MGTDPTEVDCMPYASESKNKDKTSYDYSAGFIRSCPDILMHLNEDLRVLFVNEAFQSTFHLSNNDVKGMAWEDTPFSRQETGVADRAELRRQLTANGGKYDFTFSSTSTDGSESCQYHTRLYAENGNSNSLTYWVVGRNIGAVGNKAKTYAANYDRLVKNYPDLVCRYDKEHRIIYANEACQKFFGIDSEELVGKKKEDLGLVSEEGLESWNKKLKATFKEGETDDITFEVIFNGKSRHFHSVIVPEKGSAGSVEHILAITREVTDLKNTESQLRKDNEDLRSLNTYLDNFIYTIAHDLRGPVGNLKSLLWLYKLESDDKARQDIMNKLEDTFGRLDNRLNGLIGLIESMANLESKIATCKLENIIRDIQADLENRPDFTPYTIHKHLDVKEIKYIEAYMVSILSNLLSNIMKYREPSRPLRIRVSTYRMGEFVILEVEDNGIGIDLENIGKDLFKPFRRFTKQSEGKGIGLHIIKTMVEKNGGRIEVNSTVGEGTTFQLYLKEY
ncbi:ATP-binding protein [Roseivirga sp. BDSF3-8]|uniref:PAS domain-containing sensor histidine kinase n=1 Tax=Roseivirga sp. BDSF3-8 TaxID=3241598 RepID=UPI003531C6DF